jgi:hypothetical protein
VSMKERNLAKFLLLAIPFLCLAIPVGYWAHKAPERQEFDGVVTSIEWETRNHGMPLIEVSVSKRDKVKFNSNRITLDSLQLKVGDSISKTSDSIYCLINGIKVQCLN